MKSLGCLPGMSLTSNLWQGEIWLQKLSPGGDPAGAWVVPALT